MGFDHRRSEPLLLLVFLSVAFSIGVHLAGRPGRPPWSGWRLILAAVALAAAAIVLLVMAMVLVGLALEWLTGWLKDRKR